MMNILFYLPESANTDLVDYLVSKNLQLILVTDDDVLESIDAEPYNIAILYDYKNRAGDITLISRINSRGKFCPIIQVSTCEDVNIKISLFKLGIVEYIVRPCDYEEFYLRVMAILNLTYVSMTTKDANNSIDYYTISRDYVLDIQSRRLCYKNEKIFCLFPAEFSILTRLLTAKTRLVSNNELIRAARIKQKDKQKAQNCLRATISGLRRKLILDRNIFIEAVGNRGYMLLIRRTSTNNTTAEDLAADLL